MDETPGPLWRYVTLADYERPAEPGAAAVHHGLKGLWERLRPRREVDANSANAAERLYDASSRFLDRLAPQPSWSELGVALADELGSWLAADPSRQPAQVVVGPPGSAAAEAVAAWATSNSAPLVELPSTQELLAGGREWLARLEASPAPCLAIARLERCYLRHADGLGLVRRLMDTILAGRRRLLVGCDGWAWRYLAHVAGIEALCRSPLALAALDGERLARWFAALASGCGAVVFLRAETGSQVLVVPVEPRTKEHAEGRIDAHFARLAAWSRGIPGIAWTQWRRSLSLSTSEEIAEKAWQEPAADGSRTVWVKAWDKLDWPRMPLGEPRAVTRLLHTLLLHGGLDSERLAVVLPLEDAGAGATLRALAERGLVERAEDGTWSVASLAYPAVRDRMAAEEFLLDQC